MNKKLVILLVVGLIVGIGVGYGIVFTVYHSEINTLKTGLSTAQTEIGDLETQVSDLHSSLENTTAVITGLQSNLEDALDEASAMEITISEIEGACEQLEKDAVFLEKLKEIMTDTNRTGEETILVWNEVKELSRYVDSVLPNAVNNITDNLVDMMDYVNTSTGVDWEEKYYWIQGFMDLVVTYDYSIFAFGHLYTQTIISHIEAVTTLASS